MYLVLLGIIFLFFIPTISVSATLEYEKIWLFEKGVESFQLREFDDAISYFDRVLEIDPNHLDSLSNKGGVLLEIGKYKETMILLEQALEIDPNHLGALSNKGKTLFQISEYEQSIAVFEKILEIEPNHIYALYNKGNALFELGKHNEALKYFEDVLEIEPDHYVSNVQVFTKNKKIYKSIDGLLEVIVRDSNDNLINYFQSTKFRALDADFLEPMFDEWPVLKVINQDGKDIKVQQITLTKSYEEVKYPGGGGFSVVLYDKSLPKDSTEEREQTLWFLHVAFNVFPIEEGDSVTYIYTIFRPVE